MVQHARKSPPIRKASTSVSLQTEGSLGAGNDSVLSLPGNVGDSDVKDCYQALQECLSTFENIDSDRYVISNYCFNLRTVFMLQFCH